MQILILEAIVKGPSFLLVIRLCHIIFLLNCCTVSSSNAIWDFSIQTYFHCSVNIRMYVSFFLSWSVHFTIMTYTIGMKVFYRPCNELQTFIDTTRITVIIFINDYKNFGILSVLKTTSHLGNSFYSRDKKEWNWAIAMLNKAFQQLVFKQLRENAILLFLQMSTACSTFWFALPSSGETNLQPIFWFKMELCGVNGLFRGIMVLKNQNWHS